VVAHLAKASLAAQMQYRLDFLLQIAMEAFWVTWNVAPIFIVYQIRPSIAGFTLDEALLVMSAFILLRAFLEGFISPNLTAVVQHIRSGSFDFILLKPIDSQLMVSTARWAPAKLVGLTGGLALAAWSLVQVGPKVTAPGIALAALMLLGGAVMLYSLWLLVICIAFWFVRVDNLSYLFGSIFDAGRWPITVFHGWVRAFLTFVLPVAVMTSFPAFAALGRLRLEEGVLAAFGSLAFLALSRRVWLFAVGHYASASS
jgi:ABC-2 type transport system permease protein